MPYTMERMSLEVSLKSFNSELLITLLHRFLTSLNLVDLYVLFDISFIRFGSLKVKLQLFFGDVSVLKVCNLNTNYSIKKFKSVLGRNFCRMSIKRCFLIYEESW